MTDPQCPNAQARKMLEGMKGLAGNRPRHAWQVGVIVPADLKRKPTNVEPGRMLRQ